VSARAIELRLPESERRLAAALADAWRDLLYAPGAGFTSPLDPGAYRSSFAVLPAAGAAIRVSSHVVPAFGGDLCRLRLEAVERSAVERLGSFFEPARRGTVYALGPDRSAGAARALEHAAWRYEGPALASRLAPARGVWLLRERGRGSDGSWEADRGLVLAGREGAECLLLSVPEPSEAALFLPEPGLHRALLDPALAPPPGVSVRELLGYGAWPGDVEVTVDVLAV
jgi:hypothetical protein